MKTRFLFTALFLALSISISTPGLTEEEILNDELINLCLKFPYNSRCEEVGELITLDKRSGEYALACVLKIEDSESKALCKYELESDFLTVYMEEGESLEYLDGKKATQVVRTSTSNIAKLFYSENTKKNRPSLLNIIPPVRILHKFKKSEKISLISIVFPEEIEINNKIESVSSAEERTTTEQKIKPLILTLVLDLERGAEVRSQLEKLTGLTSEAPPVKN